MTTDDLPTGRVAFRAENGDASHPTVHLWIAAADGRRFGRALAGLLVDTARGAAVDASPHAPAVRAFAALLAGDPPWPTHPARTFGWCRRCDGVAAMCGPVAWGRGAVGMLEWDVFAGLWRERVGALLAGTLDAVGDGAGGDGAGGDGAGGDGAGGDGAGGDGGDGSDGNDGNQEDDEFPPRDTPAEQRRWLGSLARTLAYPAATYGGNVTRMRPWAECAVGSADREDVSR